VRRRAGERWRGLERVWDGGTWGVDGRGADDERGARQGAEGPWRSLGGCFE